MFQLVDEHGNPALSIDTEQPVKYSELKYAHYAATVLEMILKRRYKVVQA